MVSGIAELDPRSFSLSWFVINTLHSADRYAYDFLTGRAFSYEVYWPRVEVREGTRVTIRSFLPHYLFVQDDGRGVGDLRRAPGVSNMVRCGEGVARVGGKVIDAMRKREDERGLIKLEDEEREAFTGKRKKRFARGEKVKVTLTSLWNEESNFNALFEKMDGEHRAVIFASMLGRVVKMTVPVRQMEKV